MKSLIVACFALNGSFALAKPLLTGESSLSISTKNGNQQIEKIETRFFEDVYKQQLYKFTSKTVTLVNADGADQSGTIEAYKTRNSLFDTLNWKVNVKGAEFSIFNDELLQVNEFGCCDSPTVNRLFDRANGKQIEAATNGSAIQFQVPNSNLNIRYLAAVIDSKAPQKRGNKTYVGTISYFENTQILGRVRIYAALPENYGALLYDLNPTVTGKNERQNNLVTIWNADGSNDKTAAFSDIGVTGKVSFDANEETFSILIGGDKIDKALSKASGALEFEFL